LIGDRTYNPGYRGADAPTRASNSRGKPCTRKVLTLEHPEQPGQRMSWAAALPKDSAARNCVAFRPALSADDSIQHGWTPPQPKLKVEG